MKQFNCSGSNIFKIPVTCLLIMVFISCKVANLPCRNCRVTSEWNSTNILFPSGTNSAQRLSTINQIQAEISNDIAAYNANYNYHLSVQFSVDTCICDSLLVNINSKVTHGVGESVASTSSASSRASGNGWAVISRNMKFQVVRFVDSGKVSDNRPSGTAVIPGKPVDSNTILAILDSGIDPNLFSSNISQILWQASGGLSIKNFVTERDINNNLIYNSSNNNDDHFSKHGSVVTTMALNALFKSGSSSYPKIMALKVLNNDGIGSTFDVSCALSYVNQRHANVVNLSLGYFGKPDSILHHYISLPYRNSSRAVPVIAAAGNTESPHDQTKLCDPRQNGEGLLNPSWQFFPACFDLANIISVTGLVNSSMHCQYQNYSDHFISLGVVNQTPLPCCGFNINFFPGQIREGSSFVAPIVSGLVIKNVLNTGMHNNPNQYLIDLSPVRTSTNIYTRNGAYIVY